MRKNVENTNVQAEQTEQKAEIVSYEVVAMNGNKRS